MVIHGSVVKQHHLLMAAPADEDMDQIIHYHSAACQRAHLNCMCAHHLHKEFLAVGNEIII